LEVKGGRRDTEYLSLYKRMRNVPPNQVLSVVAYPNVVREIEAVLPIDYLPVDVSPVLRAKRGPADETLEHDCAERPLCSGQLDLELRR
jgi:hypothetical protein